MSRTMPRGCYEISLGQSQPISPSSSNHSNEGSPTQQAPGTTNTEPRKRIRIPLDGSTIQVLERDNKIALLKRDASRVEADTQLMRAELADLRKRLRELQERTSQKAQPAACGCQDTEVCKLHSGKQRDREEVLDIYLDFKQRSGETVERPLSQAALRLIAEGVLSECQLMMITRRKRFRPHDDDFVGSDSDSTAAKAAKTAPPTSQPKPASSPFIELPWESVFDSREPHSSSSVDDPWEEFQLNQIALS